MLRYTNETETLSIGPSEFPRGETEGWVQSGQNNAEALAYVVVCSNGLSRVPEGR